MVKNLPTNPGDSFDLRSGKIPYVSEQLSPWAVKKKKSSSCRTETLANSQAEKEICQHE